MNRVKTGLVLAAAFMGLAWAPKAIAGHHEPVIQVVAVTVKPGMLEKYLNEVKKLQSVLERVGSKSSVRVWNATQGGPNTGTILVGLEFPNAEAWAADLPKMEADDEWQDITEDLHKLRTVNSSSLWRDISTNRVGSKPGSVLVTTGVAVKPGKLQEYQERLGDIGATTQRLDLTVRLRMWHAIMAGPNTGAVAVGAEYADLATYVKEEAKLAGDAEWQKLVADLDDIRTLTGRTLYLEITP